MIREQKIEALSNKIRKALPYLMELSEGCVVKYIDDNTLYKVNGLNFYTTGKATLYCTDLSTKTKQSCVFPYNTKYYEIIGHEPMLNDVLAWFLKITKPYYCQFLDGVFFIYYSDLSFIKYSWNLEKPYIKDQSPELINFLYSLIEQK